jgi:hypothetical protein
MKMIASHWSRSIRSLGCKSREVVNSGTRLGSYLRVPLWGLAFLIATAGPAHAQLITWYNGTS